MQNAKCASGSCVKREEVGDDIGEKRRMEDEKHEKVGRRRTEVVYVGLCHSYPYFFLIIHPLPYPNALFRRILAMPAQSSVYTSTSSGF